MLESPARDPSRYRRCEERHRAPLRFVRQLRTLEIPLPQVRRLLDFAAEPNKSCGQIDELLDGPDALVRRRVQALRALGRQLVALRRTRSGDDPHRCGILQALTAVARAQACASRSTAGLN